MKRLTLALIALLALGASVSAQVVPPGTNPVPSAGAYNSAAPTCTSGQYCALQTDVNGQLKISGTISATASTDPCATTTKTNLPISQNGTASVQLIALSGSTVIYVCSLSLIAAGATTVALTTGTGSACVTGNAAVIGSTTANIANSMSLAANGGFTLGSGSGTVARGAASSELCMVLGTNVFVSGNLTYIQQ